MRLVRDLTVFLAGAFSASLLLSFRVSLTHSEPPTLFRRSSVGTEKDCRCDCHAPITVATSRSSSVDPSVEASYHPRYEFKVPPLVSTAKLSHRAYNDVPERNKTVAATMPTHPPPHRPDSTLSSTPPQSPPLLREQPQMPSPTQNPIWLVIGISTVPRPHGERYLIKVLGELSKQLGIVSPLHNLPAAIAATDPLADQVRVVVRLGGRASKNSDVSVFEEAKRTHAHDHRFLFVDGRDTRKRNPSSNRRIFSLGPRRQLRVSAWNTTSEYGPDEVAILGQNYRPPKTVILAAPKGQAAGKDEEVKEEEKAPTLVDTGDGWYDRARHPSKHDQNASSTQQSQQSRRGLRQQQQQQQQPYPHHGNSFRNTRRRIQGLPSSSTGGSGGVGAGVRAQTKDVVALLETVQAMAAARGDRGGGGPGGLLPPFKHYMFMEDDFLPCHSALLGLWYLTRRASEYESSVAVDSSNGGDQKNGASSSLPPRHYQTIPVLRASYGLNGAIVGANELPSIAAHFTRREEKKPPDHLLLEWAEKQVRPGQGQRRQRKQTQQRPPPVLSFRHNLFWHMGKASAVGNSAGRFIPACFELLYDWLLVNERFDVRKCGHDLVSPCNLAKPEGGEEDEPPLGHHASVSPKTGRPFPCSVSAQDSPLLFASKRFLTCTGGAGNGATSAAPKKTVGGPNFSGRQKKEVEAGKSGSGGTRNRDDVNKEEEEGASSSSSVAVGVLASQGHDCHVTCARYRDQDRAGGVGGHDRSPSLSSSATHHCQPASFKVFNSCDALAVVLGRNCTTCEFSRGSEQPAVEEMKTNGRGGDKDDDDNSHVSTVDDVTKERLRARGGAHIRKLKCLVNRALDDPSCVASHPRTRRICPCALTSS